MTSKTRSNGWTLTFQSWSEEDCALAMSLYEEDDNCTYLIVGFETAPRTGRQHLQCYVYYKEKIRMSYLLKVIPGVHVEPQRAKDNVAAYSYCAEDGDWIEFGVRPRQGHRTDLEMIKHDLLKKTSMKKISTDYFSQWCQYRRSFDEFQRLHELVSHKTEFIIYFEKSISKIYTDYPVSTSLILTTEYDLPQSQVLHAYYSGKYTHIFMPCYPGDEVWGDYKYKILSYVI